MGHNHSGHNHHHDAKGKKLFITILLNIFITVAQIIGGLLSGSLALISDAMHNFSDVMALVISWIADKIARRKYSKKQTFGFKRAEILAALINIVTIIFIAVKILIEAITRFGNPVEVTGLIVILLAGFSIIMNGASVLIIKKDAKNNMNIKSAYLHLFSDMLTSIAVMIGGIITMAFKIYWIDSLISILIAVYLIYSSLGLLFETLRILMQFTPKNLDVDEIASEIENDELIKAVHHMHIWKLTDSEIYLEARICFNEDYKISQCQERIITIKKTLNEKYKITHVTFEYENHNHNDMVRVLDER